MTTSTTTPTTVTQYQTGFQPQLSPYEQAIAGSAMGTVFTYETDSSGNPVLDPNTGLPIPSGFQAAPNTLYNANQTYNGQQVAQFTPLQLQAFQNAQNMGTASQLDQGTTVANQASQMGLNANYQYNPYASQNVTGAQGQASQLGNAPTATASQFNQPLDVAAQQVGSQNFTGNNVSQYMNPYLQQSLDPQIALLQQQQGQQQAANQSQATQAGAFGGSREGVQDALQNQSNQLAMSNLIGQGYNTAYNNAEQQFNTSNAANLQAQQANQSAGLQAGLANQQTSYNTGLQNAQLSQQAALANQSLAGQYGLQQGSMNNQMGLQNLANTQQANLANQQAAQNAAQLNANQQQFGAGYTLQGANTALTGANTLGTLGQNLYSQNIGINQLQNSSGMQQQQQTQNVMNANYGNYMANAQYPQQGLSFLSNMYNSLPTSTQSTSTYNAAPTALQTLGAVGSGIYGLSKIATGGLAKDHIKMKRGGLGAIALHNIGD
jgi:hypothetical protein